MPERIASPMSILATIGLILAIIWLGVRGGILGTGALSISLQTLGLMIVVWARLTFGFRTSILLPVQRRAAWSQRGRTGMFAILFISAHRSLSCLDWRYISRLETLLWLWWPSARWPRG